MIKLSPNNKLKPGDLLIYNGECFEPIADHELLKEIKILKNDLQATNDRLLLAETELAFNRGDITKEEFEKVCGLNK